MKRFTIYASIVILLFLSSGCTTVKQNTNGINQLKNQMVNVESILSRQNLLIQQNKTDVDQLLDRNDEISIELSRVKDQRTVISQAAPSSRTRSIRVETTETRSALISDKLQPQPSIQNIQMALRNAGFYIGNIDGKVGALTRKGVKNFQEANNLTADGVVGRRTWAKLKDYL